MKSKILIFFTLVFLTPLFSCTQKEKPSDVNIIFLHHSTGRRIWNGEPNNSIAIRIARRISSRLASYIDTKPKLLLLFEKYNKETNKNYLIKEMNFPKAEPYGWNNYPYDYYNLWVKNSGEEPYLTEPTIEILTREYDVIIFKHCYPVSNILEDTGFPDIESQEKRIENYKLQYNALKTKLHEFPDNKFILWTPAVHVKNLLTPDEAERTRIFYEWITQEWDMPGDNIYLWDFYSLQTEGNLYFKDEYAGSANDSHPNGNFSGIAVKLLFNRILDVIENNGNKTQLTGLEN